MGGSEASSWERSHNSRWPNARHASSDSLGLFHSNRLRGLSRDSTNNSGCIAEAREDDQPQSSNAFVDNQIGSSGVCENEVEDLQPLVTEAGDISLRQWLDKPDRSVDRMECLHIFKQIVESVHLAHSQRIVVHNVRPSCFVMSPLSRVSFIESASGSSSGSDSYIEGLDSKAGGDESCSSPYPHGSSQEGFALPGNDVFLDVSPASIFQNASDGSSLHVGLDSVANASSLGENHERNAVEHMNVSKVGDMKKTFPLKPVLLMELNWYTSPEEASGASGSFASDIYRLGVLLFELFCTFSSTEEKLRNMSNLRHRVLPPQLLLKWPKEASFCLWLLHPQPNTRPKMSEVLESEFLNEPRDKLEERDAAIKIREEIEEQELLLEFLLQLQQRKQEIADKLQDTICILSSDIEEVQKQQTFLKKSGKFYSKINKEEHSSLEKVEDSTSLGSQKRHRGLQVDSDEDFGEHSIEGQRSTTLYESQERIFSKSSRLMKNFKKLESAYFSTRCRLMKPTDKPSYRSSAAGSSGRGSTAQTEGSSVDNLSSKEGLKEKRGSGWLNPFLEGLSKYLSFSKFKVRADLKQVDLLNSPNLVCSLGFDRDREFFASAGVNRKIKIFECDAILNEERDIHYPVIEMASRSKLSSISWNSYIKSQIASSDFEGIVQVWDVARGQVYMEMREHERRVWSVDFSKADPTKLASGSDDGTVKLWNINQGASVGTIGMKAHICCVQFPPDSARSLLVGSADHKVYCYDLRNLRVPWCTLVGHTKTVSYVKFLDSSTLVSASTDNSLKLWDLTMNTSRMLSCPIQTFTGHTNIKNFVGLSLSDGYIATGSETNEVCVYHKAFPMPVLSFKFDNTDPLSGQEVDDSTQFISSVCWRGQSTTLVAANSTGNIKVLEMV